MSARNERLDQLRRVIPLVTPAEALDLQHEGGTLIDIRESDEIAQGSPQQAHRIPRGFLELRIEEHLSDLEATVLVMCAGSTRSLFAAESLRQLGYRDVRVVDGGFTRWKASGLPVELPRRLKPEDHERYSRHLTIPEIGVEGQAKLLEGKVLLVGAGGLGSPAALYLAAAGVGTLGIVDDDYVDRSNLQRQVLHDDTRLGMSKVESARATLAALNPGVQVVTSNERLDIGNVERIFAGYDVILDGSDNFATRYLVNDACVKLG
ncbi:MAG: ThiF family adenylyltransferase, partial [Acidobacteriota bacterium]